MTLVSSRLLRGITDDLAILRRESAAGQDRRADPIWLRGVTYPFVTARSLRQSRLASTSPAPLLGARLGTSGRGRQDRDRGRER